LPEQLAHIYRIYLRLKKEALVADAVEVETRSADAIKKRILEGAES